AEVASGSAHAVSGLFCSAFVQAVSSARCACAMAASRPAASLVFSKRDHACRRLPQNLPSAVCLAAAHLSARSGLARFFWASAGPATDTESATVMTASVHAWVESLLRAYRMRTP